MSDDLTGERHDGSWSSSGRLFPPPSGRRCTCPTTDEIRAAIQGHIDTAVAAERERIGAALERAVRDHADHMATYTLPAIRPGFMDGWNHALNLLRRDADFIAHRLDADYGRWDGWENALHIARFDTSTIARQEPTP